MMTKEEAILKHWLELFEEEPEEEEDPDEEEEYEPEEQELKITCRNIK